MGKRDGTIGQVVVLAAPTLIAIENINRLDIAIVNGGTQTIYLGEDVSVSTINGFPLLQGMGIAFDSYIGSLYGLVVAGNAVCGVIEI